MTAASSMTLNIRLATPADRPRLVALINSAFAIETFLEVAGIGHPLAFGIERGRRGGHVDVSWGTAGWAPRMTTERGPTR